MEGVLTVTALADNQRHMSDADIEAHLRRALHVALRIASDSATAEDAVQQAFLATWHKQTTLRDAAAFWPYMLKAMVRLLWAEDRATRRTAPDSNTVERRTADQPDAEQNLGAAEQRVALHAAIADLPERRRQVVELRLAGLGGREVALALDMSHSTMRVTYHQALRDLRARLGWSE